MPAPGVVWKTRDMRGSRTSSSSLSLPSDLSGVIAISGFSLSCSSYFLVISRMRIIIVALSILSFTNAFSKCFSKTAIDRISCRRRFCKTDIRSFCSSNIVLSASRIAVDVIVVPAVLVTETFLPRMFTWELSSLIMFSCKFCRRRTCSASGA